MSVDTKETDIENGDEKDDSGMYLSNAAMEKNRKMLARDTLEDKIDWENGSKENEVNLAVTTNCFIIKGKDGRRHLGAGMNKMDPGNGKNAISGQEWSRERENCKKKPKVNPAKASLN